MGRSAPVSRLAGAASTALAQASAKLAGDHQPASPAPGEPQQPATVTKSRADALRKTYSRAERRVDAAKEALAAAKADIVAEMGAADALAVAETGRLFAELKAVTSLTFDSTRFRSEHPDQAAAYMKAQVSRRFRLLP